MFRAVARAVWAYVRQPVTLFSYWLMVAAYLSTQLIQGPLRMEWYLVFVAGTGALGGFLAYMSLAKQIALTRHAAVTSVDVSVATLDAMSTMASAMNDLGNMVRNDLANMVRVPVPPDITTVVGTVEETHSFDNSDVVVRLTFKRLVCGRHGSSGPVRFATISALGHTLSWGRLLCVAWRILTSLRPPIRCWAPGRQATQTYPTTRPPGWPTTNTA